MKKFLILLVAMVTISSCATFGFKSSNIVEFKDDAGNTYQCKVTNEDTKTGYAHCVINHKGNIYNCTIDLNNVNDRINIEQSCEIIAN